MFTFSIGFVVYEFSIASSRVIEENHYSELFKYISQFEKENKLLKNLRSDFYE